MGLLDGLDDFADDAAGADELASHLGISEKKAEEKLEKLEKEGKVRKRDDLPGPSFFEKK